MKKINIKNLKDIIKSYNLNSIFTQYIILLTPLFLIIFFVITFTITSGINTTENSRNQTQFDIDAYRVKNSMSTVINSIPSYHTTLSAEASQTLTNDISEYNLELSTVLKNFTQLLNNIKNSNPQLASIYVYSKSQDYIYSSNSSICASNYAKYFLHTEVFDEYFKNQNVIIFNEKNLNNQKYTYMSIIYPIITESTQPLGYIAYNIDIGSIVNSITHPICVIQNNKILYSAHADETITVEKIENISSEKCVRFEFPDIEASIFMVNNYKPARIPIHTYILLTVLVIILSLTLSCIISYSFYYKIDMICSLLKNPFSSPLKDTRSVKQNEISYIADNIKALILSQNNAKKEIADKLRQLSEAQATALQFQISPHFLFNTLNLISSIAMQELKKDTKIIMVTDSLSRILYDTLDTSVLICTLERELEYIKNYIEIQKLKYDDFIIEYHIPDENLNLPVIRFMLQPIIENALHHGIFSIETTERKIILSSTIDYINNVHTISIKNTGRLIDGATVQKINQKMANIETIPQHSIGLWNTNKRIKLLFGNNYGCTFFSLPEGGAEVKICLPLD